jgi:hypothetical protein
VDQDLAGLVAEGPVLLELATGQVVEPRQLERLLKLLRGLAALVQRLQVPLLCAQAGRGKAGPGSRAERERW